MAMRIMRRTLSPKSGERVPGFLFGERLPAREGGAAGFAAIDAGFNCSIFGDLPIA
jgi:hypothetical protein